MEVSPTSNILINVFILGNTKRGRKWRFRLHQTYWEVESSLMNEHHNKHNCVFYIEAFHTVHTYIQSLHFIPTKCTNYVETSYIQTCQQQGLLVQDQHAIVCNPQYTLIQRMDRYTACDTYSTGQHTQMRHYTAHEDTGAT
jgi:hypothetical protein